MEFEEILAELGENFAGVPLYSVENRDMTDHETEISFFYSREEAIVLAEKIWSEFDGDDRDYHDVSVHKGEIEYYPQFDRYRFIVLQKLYKAYKKIYVCESFAEAFRRKKADAYAAQGMSAEDAAAQAKKDFQELYAVQPANAVGMFVGYDYAPEEL